MTERVEIGKGTEKWITIDDVLIKDRIRTDNGDLTLLKGSLVSTGQLQNIIVWKDGDKYHLVAGGRRCAAIIELVEEGRHDGKVKARVYNKEPSEYVADTSNGAISMIVLVLILLFPLACLFFGLIRLGIWVDWLSLPWIEGWGELFIWFIPFEWILVILGSMPLRQ